MTTLSAYGETSQHWASSDRETFRLETDGQGDQGLQDEFQRGHRAGGGGGGGRRQKTVWKLQVRHQQQG